VVALALEMSMHTPETSSADLSVVVIGRNEGERLSRCIRSIQTMKFAGRVELIYVDSASTDGSALVADSMGARVISVLPLRPTAALGRNAGWKSASAPIVLFLDGDTLLHEQFVADSLSAFSDPSVAIVWGHRREINTGASLYNRVLDLDWIYAPGFVEFCGGDALVRRDVLQRVSGFDENLIAGEEPEMCRRIRALGYKILHIDRPMTGHDLAMTKWRQYWRRATRAGYAYAEVSARFRNTDLPFWGEEVEKNRRRFLVLLSIPIIGLALSILFWSMLPGFVALGGLLLLVLRTAWKAGWKSSSWPTRFLYGIHSHFQQIPIFAGQLQYAKDRKQGRSRGLIEYKNLAS
jgi:glycosyltransferase involved in cell wall biosynthesis